MGQSLRAGPDAADGLEGQETLRTLTITPRQLTFVGWTMTLLAFIVVLNVWVEINDRVIIDSFILSIATAAVLLALVVLILRFEHRTKRWFASHEGQLYRVLGPVSTLAILFLSKFLILEVVDIIFGQHVELGGLLDVIVLVLLLIVAQKGMVAIWRALGPRDGAADMDIIAE
jgi:hypothetical protein